MASPFQLNGNFPDWSSVEIVTLTKRLTGLTALSFNETLEGGEVRGLGSQKLGETRGQYKCEGSMEMYLADFRELVTALSATGGATDKGYMESRFDITVSYTESGISFIQSVQLIGCRMKKVENSHQLGSDPLKVKADLSMAYIVRDGQFPIGVAQALGTRF